MIYVAVVDYIVPSYFLYNKTAVWSYSMYTLSKVSSFVPFIVKVKSELVFVGVTAVTVGKSVDKVY